MLKKHLSWSLTALLLLVPGFQAIAVGQKDDKQELSLEKIKTRIAKLGVGEKAKATITLKDGAKTKGYIARAAEDDFVIRDRKTDAPTTIRYADVAQVESNRGHSTAKHLAIGIGAGVGATIAILAIILTHLD
jgi:hypothetical protein